MESASWQRPLYGFEISQNQAKMPLKSGFSDGLGGGNNCLKVSTLRADRPKNCCPSFVLMTAKIVENAQTAKEFQRKLRLLSENCQLIIMNYLLFCEAQ